MKRICVFCGSNTGSNPLYPEVARQLGQYFADRGLGLVYGGARIGLMGLIADSALAAGVETIGVIPEVLIDKELAHRGLTQLEIVDSMQARKARMAALSDAFLVLPGGLGSMDELFEVWTWIQVGIHQKASGLLNVEGYYDHLIAFLNKTVSEGFVSQNLRDCLLVSDKIGELLDQLIDFKPLSSAQKYPLKSEREKEELMV